MRQRLLRDAAGVERDRQPYLESGFRRRLVDDFREPAVTVQLHHAMAGQPAQQSVVGLLQPLAPDPGRTGELPREALRELEVLGFVTYDARMAEELRCEVPLRILTAQRRLDTEAPVAPDLVELDEAHDVLVHRTLQDVGTSQQVLAPQEPLVLQQELVDAALSLLGHILVDQPLDLGEPRVGAFRELADGQPERLLERGVVAEGQRLEGRRTDRGCESVLPAARRAHALAVVPPLRLDAMEVDDAAAGASHAGAVHPVPPVERQLTDGHVFGEHRAGAVRDLAARGFELLAPPPHVARLFLPLRAVDDEQLADAQPDAGEAETEGQVQDEELTRVAHGLPPRPHTSSSRR